MYFDLITIGIATSVRTKWAIQLVLCTVVIIFIVKFVQKLSQKYYGKSFYSLSFNEGIVSNTLEVTSNEKIEAVENSENLVSSLDDKNTNEVIYRMNFENKKTLQEFKQKLEEQKNIKKINVILS
jgi:uncharacterized membrane protein YhiD involved in acid resistance